MIAPVGRFSRGGVVKHIAVIRFDSYPSTGNMLRGFATNLKQSLLQSCTIHTFCANGDSAALYAHIMTVLDSNFDLIVTLGTRSTLLTHQQCTQRNVSTPVIFVDMQDPIRHKIIDSYSHSSTNFTGVLTPNNIHEEGIKHLFRLQPFLKRVLLVYDSQHITLTQCDELQRIKTHLRVRDIEIHEIGLACKSEAFDLLDRALDVQDVQAIFTLRHEAVLSSMPELARAANKHQVPLYCSDIDSVHIGAAIGCGVTQYELGEKAAHKAELILNNDGCVGCMPITLHAEPYTLVANTWSMKQQGLFLSPRGSQWLSTHATVI